MECGADTTHEVELESTEVDEIDPRRVFLLGFARGWAACDSRGKAANEQKLNVLLGMIDAKTCGEVARTLGIKVEYVHKVWTRFMHAIKKDLAARPIEALKGKSDGEEEQQTGDAEERGTRIINAVQDDQEESSEDEADFSALSAGSEYQDGGEDGDGDD